MGNKAINKFEAEQLQILDFRTTEEATSVPETFEEALISDFNTTFRQELSFNLTQKLIRSQFSIEVETVSGNSKEAKAQLTFVFIFHCANFEDLAQKQGEKVKIDARLGIAITTITHSTARGILLTKLNDTVFSEFILPIVTPKLPE